MYKINYTTSKEEYGVIRLNDETFIPPSIGNVDYQEYLRWVEEGNIPEPSDSEEV